MTMQRTFLKKKCTTVLLFTESRAWACCLLSKVLECWILAVAAGTILPRFLTRAQLRASELIFAMSNCGAQGTAWTARVAIWFKQISRPSTSAILDDLI